MGAVYVTGALVAAAFSLSDVAHLSTKRDAADDGTIQREDC